MAPPQAQPTSTSVPQQPQHVKEDLKLFDQLQPPTNDTDNSSSVKPNKTHGGQSRYFPNIFSSNGLFGGSYSSNDAAATSTKSQATFDKNLEKPIILKTSPVMSRLLTNCSHCYVPLEFVAVSSPHPLVIQCFECAKLTSVDTTRNLSYKYSSQCNVSTVDESGSVQSPHVQFVPASNVDPATLKAFSHENQQPKPRQANSVPASNNSNLNSTSLRSERASTKMVKDDSLYALLNVPVDATPEAIRKGYRVMAMRYHPDKNHAPDADDMFKAVSAAYKTLSDPHTRSLYDTHGLSALRTGGGEDAKVDGLAMFREMFGGDLFSDIIGDISLGSIFEAATKPAQSQEVGTSQNTTAASMPSEEELIQARITRVEALTKSLAQKLDSYVRDGDPSAFRKTIMREVDELRLASFGVPLLHSVGYTYGLKAQQFLSMGLVSFYHRMRERGHIVYSSVSTIRAVIDLKNADTAVNSSSSSSLNGEEAGVATDTASKDTRPLSKAKPKKTAGPTTPESAEKLQEEMANRGINVLWKASQLDLESVIREVCDNVLSVKSIERELMKLSPNHYDIKVLHEKAKVLSKQRADGLKIIAECYSSAEAEDGGTGFPKLF